MDHDTCVVLRPNSSPRSSEQYWGKVIRFRQSHEPGNPQARLPPGVEIQRWTYREIETVTIPCSHIARVVGIAEFQRHVQEEKNKLPARYVGLVDWVQPAESH